LFEIHLIMLRDQLHFCTVMDSRQFSSGNRIFSLFFLPSRPVYSSLVRIIAEPAGLIGWSRIEPFRAD
jgi:hypothetical protein